MRVNRSLQTSPPWDIIITVSTSYNITITSPMQTNITILKPIIIAIIIIIIIIIISSLLYHHIFLPSSRNKHRGKKRFSESCPLDRVNWWKRLWSITYAWRGHEKKWSKIIIIIIIITYITTIIIIITHIHHCLPRLEAPSETKSWLGCWQNLYRRHGMDKRRNERLLQEHNLSRQTDRSMRHVCLYGGRSRQPYRYNIHTLDEQWSHELFIQRILLIIAV